MVVFWFPGDQSKSYIKRVNRHAGDIVRVDNGMVMVNGKRSMRLCSARVP